MFPDIFLDNVTNNSGEKTTLFHVLHNVSKKLTSSVITYQEILAPLVFFNW